MMVNSVKYHFYKEHFRIENLAFVVDWPLVR